MKNITKTKVININIQNCQKKNKISVEILKNLVSKIHIKIPPSKVNVILVSDRKITQLNKKFLGKNIPTDVLSFPISKDCGEIVISTETAERNAKIYSYSLEKEILYLIIHGILHLKGYKDNNRKDALKMKKQQNIIFKKLLDGQKI